MNLNYLLDCRASAGNPVRVALVGAGKFGSMFLSQSTRLEGLHVAAVVDLLPSHARKSLARAGWSKDRYSACSISEALRKGTTYVTDDALSLIESDGIEVFIDATGNPTAGISHALACSKQGKHIIMVNVEADALAGPLLRRRARSAGTVYSLAYGDQPALICELVDWARASGFKVIAAGKGTKYLPEYHYSTPDTVWRNYGFTASMVDRGNFNAQMFNSFLDGTKSAIEMAAVANATGLTPAPGGLSFPPCSVDELPSILRPRSAGGQLHHASQVEVVSSVTRDGKPVPRDLRWGVYVVFSTDSSYSRSCFKEYGLITDDSGNYCATYKPYHLIGLELSISVASVALRCEPTGAPNGFRADVVAIAKRDLGPGDILDGEGGYTVYGQLMPASDSMNLGGLPIGLANNAKIIRPVEKGSPLKWADVKTIKGDAARFRREMEKVFIQEHNKLEP